MTARKLFVFASSMDGGGSERQTLTLLRWLDQNLWNTELLLLYRRGVLLPEVPSYIPVRAFWDDHVKPRFWLPGRIHRMQVAWLRQQIQEHQPAVLYDRGYHATLISGPATQGLAVGRVSTITSPPDVELVRPRDSWIPIKKRRLARAYRAASATIAVSQSTAQAAEAFYHLPQNSVRVIPNPIDIQAVLAASKEPPEVPLQENCIHIACVGRMTIEKGHQILLEAVRVLAKRSLPTFHIWLAGDGPLRANLEAYVQAHDLTSQVTFLGHIAGATSLIARAHVLCVPSLYEGMPNVILEAMALGTPVVATATGGALELSEQGRCFPCVPPGDAQALADPLAQRILDPTLGKQSAKIAQVQIQQRDCANVIPRLTELFLEIADHLPRSPLRDR